MKQPVLGKIYKSTYITLYLTKLASTGRKSVVVATFDITSVTTATITVTVNTIRG